MKFDLVFILVGLALAVPTPASACRCTVSDGPLLRSGNKGIVATGRVIEVRPPDESGIISADIEITEPFLNARADTRVVVYTHAGEQIACGWPRLQQGEDYLLVTDYVAAKGSLWRSLPTPSQIIWLCGRTQVLNSPQGQKMLAAIREEKRRVPAR
jgi:hypothetical protein